MADRKTLREQSPLPDGMPAAIPYRPESRPPMAVLIALDDGSLDRGEAWRVRESRHVIGRKKGQTIIAHDGKMSGEHAAVTRESTDGRYAWSLSDLGSTNGTFLRVRQAVITDRCQILLGSRRYVFHLEGDASDNAPAGNAPRDQTPTHQLYLGPELDDPVGNCLAECGPEGIGRRCSFQSRAAWIGSARNQCDIAIEDDRLVCPRHACVRRDRQRRWRELSMRLPSPCPQVSMPRPTNPTLRLRKGICRPSPPHHNRPSLRTRRLTIHPTRCTA